MTESSDGRRSYTVTWQDQAKLLADDPDMSGLEYMTGMVDGEIVTPPVLHVMALRPVAAEYGRVRFEMDALEPFTNHWGVLAGGVIATALDTALACAVLTTLNSDQDVVSLDLNVDYLRSIRGDRHTVTIDAEVAHASRSRGLATGSIVDGDGRLYATGKSNCMIRPKP